MSRRITEDLQSSSDEKNSDENNFIEQIKHNGITFFEGAILKISFMREQVWEYFLMILIKNRLKVLCLKCSLFLIIVLDCKSFIRLCMNIQSFKQPKVLLILKTFYTQSLEPYLRFLKELCLRCLKVFLNMHIIFI